MAQYHTLYSLTLFETLFITWCLYLMTFYHPTSMLCDFFSTRSSNSYPTSQSFSTSRRISRLTTIPYTLDGLETNHNSLLQGKEVCSLILRQDSLPI